MDGSTIGLIGGVIGSIIGVAGGAIGTHLSIKNTKGPIERSFMIKLAVGGWIFIASFLAVILFVPVQFKTAVWVLYSVLLPLAIILGNRKLQQIRSEESNE